MVYINKATTDNHVQCTTCEVFCICENMLKMKLDKQRFLSVMILV